MIAFVIGLVLGGVAGFFIGDGKAASVIAALEADIAALKARLKKKK